MEETKTQNINKIKRVKKVEKVDVLAETICEDTMVQFENDRINEELGVEDEEEIITEELAELRRRQQLTATGLIHFFGSQIKSFSYENGNISIKFNDFSKKNNK